MPTLIAGTTQNNNARVFPPHEWPVDSTSSLRPLHNCDRGSHLLYLLHQANRYFTRWATIRASPHSSATPLGDSAFTRSWRVAKYFLPRVGICNIAAATSQPRNLCAQPQFGQSPNVYNCVNYFSICEDFIRQLARMLPFRHTLRR